MLTMNTWQDEEDDHEDEVMTEEQRMEEGRRMFQIFAARMFEQRVLSAYREKVYGGSQAFKAPRADPGLSHSRSPQKDNSSFFANWRKKIVQWRSARRRRPRRPRRRRTRRGILIFNTLFGCVRKLTWTLLVM
jgi:hypothetical protein